MGKIIAIDGPAGSGKSTIAKIIAKECNLLNIDTGATYRCVALAVLKNNIHLNDIDKIIALTKTLKIELKKDNTVFLNGENVTDQIRSKEVNEIVSPISSIEEVRKILVNLQRKMADDHDVILEGRDITTVVFPNADYKFYLDATLEGRANRRYIEVQEKKLNMIYEEIYANIKNRDYNDMHKKVGSLKRTNEQIYIDTTNKTIEEVKQIILKVVKGDEK